MGFGIDIGATAVKVVALRRTMGGFKLEGAARKRIPATETPEGQRMATGRALKEAVGGATAQTAVVGLSGRDINLRVVQQPKTSAVNYRQMMFYEVEQAKGQEGDLYADSCT